VSNDPNALKPHGQPIAIDPNAVSASPTEPAFIARPAGAPVYYGFEVLSDVAVHGFVLGKITDFEAEVCEYGDAFVIAPDNSRAGLVWEYSDIQRFEQVLPPGPNRWGVWDVNFPLPMTSRENARQNLASVLPRLRLEWDKWRTSAQDNPTRP
jgi:hypothetical protein